MAFFSELKKFSWLVEKGVKVELSYCANTTVNHRIFTFYEPQETANKKYFFILFLIFEVIFFFLKFIEDFIENNYSSEINL